MTFALKARFSGIVVARLAQWLADQPDNDAKRDIFDQIEAAKRDPAHFPALRIKWAYYQLREIAPGIIEREPASDLRDDLRDTWAFLSAEILKASPDWVEAARHLDTFHAHMKHAVHFDDARAVIDTGARVRKPLKRANDDRKRVSVDNQNEWQRLAEEKWAQPQHAGKSARAIAQLIAPLIDEKVDTVRKKISKPAQ
ncbi:hypothetical protein [Rhodanobacter thiooxydans]|jgi:hypothetical protein|uniref:hypothetical protein n=1 Tax=Rhodanobacter thiooxydans TaxID=416169 RepID=UPI000D385A68|nr:hypothetical protein [Rhodanobacter thiooxydans]